MRLDGLGGNVGPSLFRELFSLPDGEIVEFEVHVDQIMCIIGDNVYPKGSTAHVIKNLRIGEMDFKIAGSDLPDVANNEKTAFLARLRVFEPPVGIAGTLSMTLKPRF